MPPSITPNPPSAPKGGFLGKRTLVAIGVLGAIFYMASGNDPELVTPTPDSSAQPAKPALPTPATDLRGKGDVQGDFLIGKNPFVVVHPKSRQVLANMSPGSCVVVSHDSKTEVRIMGTVRLYDDRLLSGHVYTADMMYPLKPVTEAECLSNRVFDVPRVAQVFTLAAPALLKNNPVNDDRGYVGTLTQGSCVKALSTGNTTGLTQIEVQEAGKQPFTGYVPKTALQPVAMTGNTPCLAVIGPK